MESHRRNFIRLTAAGLIHIAARPFESVVADESEPRLLIRKASERGHTDLGWLDSFHSFSFGRYIDQRHMGFRSLRVINDDRISAGRGFPTHPHRDMEILSYVLEGALQHKDSTGKGSIVRPGDVQIMTAGKGITHSEFNPSKSEENHFLQIWIRPSMNGLRPSYQQQRVEEGQKRNQWRQIAAPERKTGVVAVHQDIHIFSTVLEPKRRLEYVVQRNRHAWLQVASGELVVNGTLLKAGDAIATSTPAALQVEGSVKSEALLFDIG